MPSKEFSTVLNERLCFKLLMQPIRLSLRLRPFILFALLVSLSLSLCGA